MSTPPPSQAGSPVGDPRSPSDDPPKSIGSDSIGSDSVGVPPAGEGMDAALTTIQPGGGVVMSIELAWCKLRRRYLHAFRPGFVKRMAETRQGNRGSLPFDPVDPRDVKYYRNQNTYWWAENLDVVVVDGEGIASGERGRKYRIRQITGQFARRIVCWVRPGDVLGRGEMYGMIKLGSRTELIIPKHPSLGIIAAVGDQVFAGSTVLARYRPLIRIPNHQSDASNQRG